MFVQNKSTSSVVRSLPDSAQQYVDERGQSIHYRINGLHFDITHRRTEVSPVATRFNNDTHLLGDMTVVVMQISCTIMILACIRSEKAGG